MLERFEEVQGIIEKMRSCLGMDYGLYNLLVLRNEEQEVVRYYIISEPEDIEVLSDEIKYLCGLYGLYAEIDIRFRTYAHSKTSIYKRIYNDIKNNGDGYKSKHQRESIEDTIINSILDSNTVEWHRVSVVKVSVDGLSEVKELLKKKRYILVYEYIVGDEVYVIADNTTKRSFRSLFSEYGEVLTNCFIPLYME